jgi:hypothetical protein
MISPRSSSPRKFPKTLTDQIERWRENVRRFRDSVGGDRKAAATLQVVAGDLFGIKSASLLLQLPLLPPHRQARRWFEVLNPLLPLRLTTKGELHPWLQTTFIVIYEFRIRVIKVRLSKLCLSR